MPEMRLRVGDAEFVSDASGEQLEHEVSLFKQLVRTGSSDVRTYIMPTDLLNDEEAKCWFSVHEEREQFFVWLRETLPLTQYGTVVCCIMGYRLFGQKEVAASWLMESAEQMSLRPERLDRLLSPGIESKYILVSGTKKGTKYSLDSTGDMFAKQTLACGIARQATRPRSLNLDDI